MAGLRLATLYFVVKQERQGEYYNCPHQIFLKFSGLRDNGTVWKDTQASNLLLELNFTTLKIAFDFEKKSIKFETNNHSL